MKVKVPFVVEHSWCRGKNHTIRHTFMIKALGVLKLDRHWYTSFSPAGYATHGSIVVWRPR
jgi:hypothetical protein